MGEEEYRRKFGMDRDEAIKQTRTELKDALKQRDKNKVKDLLNQLRLVFLGDDVLWANEVLANYMVSSVMGMLIAILFLTAILSAYGVFNLELGALAKYFSISILQMLVGIGLCIKFKGEKHWLKYLLMFCVCVTIACTYTALGSRVALALVIPVVLSVRYLSERFTIFVAALSGLFILSSTVLYAYLGVSLDLNCIPYENGWVIRITEGIDAALQANGLPMSEYIKLLLEWTYLPNLFQFSVIAFICTKIAKWGHRAVTSQAEVAKDFTRLDTELSLATQIQANMLPKIFPSFSDHAEYDLFASMDPAREVGGDFYDIFMIDDRTLGLVVADVSGKGVPAALFMMIGKTLIKNEALTGKSPAEVLEKVNNQLCENNEEGLFITAWFGKLDIFSGHLTAANAGHEYPALMRAGSEYKLLKDRHGFVLAGLENAKYKEYDLDLNPGDRLFLYTDGVTEATSPDDELFGTDRMLRALNANRNFAQKDLLANVRGRIDAFAGKAEQFDDITMLGLTFRGKTDPQEKRLQENGQEEGK